MRLRGWKKYGAGAGGMLVLVMALLLATGWGSAVAAQVSSVFVTNDAAHPVPVHEQGTATVGLSSSANTVRLAESTQTLFDQVVSASGSSQTFGPIAVSSDRELRLAAGPGSSGQCPDSTVTIELRVPLGSLDLPDPTLASLPLGGCERGTTTVELPGTAVELVVDKGSASSGSEHIVLFGRGN
jgi:hypothetical protein